MHTAKKGEIAPMLDWLTEKVKMETRNKRDSTRESSVPSALFSSIKIVYFTTSE